MPDQAVSADADAGVLKIAVPEDVAEKSLNFVVRADLVPHRYSQNILETFYSKPVLMPVKAPVAVEFSHEVLELTKGAENRFAGKITRNKPFAGSVDVKVTQLPKGCVAPTVTVAPGQEKFEVVVTSSEDSAISGLPVALLNVRATGGGPVVPQKFIQVRLFAKDGTSEQRR